MALKKKSVCRKKAITIMSKVWAHQPQARVSKIAACAKISAQGHAASIKMITSTIIMITPMTIRMITHMRMIIHIHMTMIMGIIITLIPMPSTLLALNQCAIISR